jgi:hypothetical protein
MQATLQTLTPVIIDIFGDMFFLFPEESQGPGGGRGVWHRVAVDISGRSPCRLTFFFAEATALTMAENYLGLDVETIKRPLISDVLKEAVNVMAGNLLNRQNDDSILGIPAYLGTMEQLDGSGSEDQIDLLVDGEPLRVTLSPIKV